MPTNPPLERTAAAVYFKGGRTSLGAAAAIYEQAVVKSERVEFERVESNRLFGVIALSRRHLSLLRG